MGTPTGIERIDPVTGDPTLLTPLVAPTRLAIVRPQCSNGFDDDGDGLVGLADAGCSGPGDNRERQGGRRRCGLGFDLALLLPALRWLAGRGRERMDHS